MNISLEQIGSAVRARRGWAVDALASLVRLPTVLGHEGPGQGLMAQYYEELGMEVHREPLDLARIESLPGFSPPRRAGRGERERDRRSAGPGPTGSQPDFQRPHRRVC